MKDKSPSDSFLADSITAIFQNFSNGHFQLRKKALTLLCLALAHCVFW